MLSSAATQGPHGEHLATLEGKRRGSGRNSPGTPYTGQNFTVGLHADSRPQSSYDTANPETPRTQAQPRTGFAMLSRAIQRRLVASLSRRNVQSRGTLQQRRWATPAPRPGDGPLMDRRADRELPSTSRCHAYI